MRQFIRGFVKAAALTSVAVAAIILAWEYVPARHMWYVAGIGSVVVSLVVFGIVLERRRSQKPTTDTDIDTEQLTPAKVNGIPSEVAVRLPLLESLRDGRAHSRQENCNSVSDAFGLTQEQRILRSKPDHPRATIDYRVGNARTWLQRNRLVEYEPIPNTRAVKAKITALGREVLGQQPTRLDDQFMDSFLASRGTSSMASEPAVTYGMHQGKNRSERFKGFPPTDPTKRMRPERLKHVTTRGEKVRSKAEVIIADRLVSYGIPYGYEIPLELGGITKLPDFTIEDLERGKTYYWEHHGMGDDPEYSEQWKHKLQWYNDHGIMQWEHGGGVNGTLIVTYDTSAEGMSSADIDYRINRVILAEG